MNTNNFKLKTLVVSLALAGYSASPALAQEADAKEANKKKEDYFEQIIVTGTPSGKAVRKVDSSYATTSMSAETIKKLAPKSTADLFKAVPGVWSESSGGVAGANVMVRGMPGSGDAPYVTVQLQGVPVYHPSTLSFLENSTLFRVDETISFMDGLRGGPNSVVSSGQPGLTTNFLLKEGSTETEGLVKYSTSDYDLQRIDGVLSGEVAEDLYFMVGGYVQQSKGLRNAQFTTDKGHQFTINLTKELDNGKLNFFTRVTDDHGQWYLPVPLTQNNDFNQLGTLNRQASVGFGPDGESKTYDFGQGRGWDGYVSGGSLNLELGNNWSFVDRFSFTKGDANTFGLVPEGSVVTLGSVADNGISATGLVSGQEYDADTLVQQQGYWVVLKEIEAFTNDLALTKTMDNLKATVGFYSTSYSAKDWWSIGNQVYQVVANGGETLTGIDCNDNADSCGWNYDIDSTGDGVTTALYGALEYTFNDHWSADVGVRRENHEVEYSVDEGLDGVVTKTVQYDNDDTAWTAGVNWQFQRNMGVFARASHGSKMPYFDDFRDNYSAYESGEDLIKDVDAFEMGFKWATENYNLYATYFATDVEDTFVPQPGAAVIDNSGKSKGVEVDAAYFSDNGLSLTLNATLQDTENTGGAPGKKAIRQPDWQIRVTPSYEFEMGDYFANVYGTLSAVDDRWGDVDNTQAIPGYEKIDLGFSMTNDNGLKFELAVQNLTDEDGLTEGDPRNAGASNGRYIMPRNMTFSVSYEFY